MFSNYRNQPRRNLNEGIIKASKIKTRTDTYFTVLVYSGSTTEAVTKYVLKLIIAVNALAAATMVVANLLARTWPHASNKN